MKKESNPPPPNKEKEKMDVYEMHIDLLGYKAKDKVTGFEGTIETVSFDLYGCVQCILKPRIDKDGKIPGGHWFDVTRLEIDFKKRIVEKPDFYRGYVAKGKKGPADKAGVTRA